MEPWPFDSTKRSRLLHFGLAGLWLRKSFHSTSAMSAIPIGMPGCPDLAASTASIDNARMALANSRRDTTVGLGMGRYLGEVKPALRRARIVAESVAACRASRATCEALASCGSPHMRLRQAA